MKPTQTEATNITILGSTGSIGTQTLDIIREYPDRFRAVALTARHNWELLARQAREFMPRLVVISDKQFHAPLCEALGDLPIRVLAGDDAVCDAAVCRRPIPL